jgi:hypothetical protein
MERFLTLTSEAESTMIEASKQWRQRLTQERPPDYGSVNMKLPLGIAAFLFALMLPVLWLTWPPVAGPKDLLNIATFVVLTLTLVALVIYAADTNSIARITREQWKRQGVFDTNYKMTLGDKQKGTAGRTVFRIRNSSKCMVRAKVRL